MPRVIPAVIAGIVIAVLSVVLFDWISHTVYPPPPGLENLGAEGLRAHIANAPLVALLLVLAGPIVGAFDGTFVACLIDRGKPSTYAMVVAAVMLAGTAMNLYMIEHPMWFAIAAIVGIPLAALLASQLASATLLPRKEDS